MGDSDSKTVQAREIRAGDKAMIAGSWERIDAVKDVPPPAATDDGESCFTRAGLWLHHGKSVTAIDPSELVHVRPGGRN